MDTISGFIRKIASKFLKNVLEAQNSRKIVVFLGGLCDDDNAWRKQIKKEFKDKNIYFLDPFDKNWEPSSNIYDELAGLLIADYVVFYKGGKGTKKEKKFLEVVEEKEYKYFDNIEDLKNYIREISIPTKRES